MPSNRPPKGTRDFYPEDMAVREYIFKAWENSCRRYGFESYDGPMFEHLEVYTQKSGEEIEKQLYTFEDKSGRRLALRPELTPTLARMVASRGPALKMPLRWYSIPPLFRYERMQRGRLRQFYQLNMDILGVAEVTADAELIAAVVGMMNDLSLDAEDFAVHISSRTLLEEVFTHIGVPSDRLASLYAALDRRAKIGADEFMENVTEIVGDPAKAETVLSVLRAESLEEITRTYGELQSVQDLVQLFMLLETYGLSDYARFDIGIVRGLAYYTGIVFEVLDRKGELRAVAGGGRYDKLVNLYGGPKTPAVGFAAGDVVLAELLKAKGTQIQQPPRAEVFLVTFDRDIPQTPIRAAQRLREAGISCEFSLTAGAVGKQMKLANAARSVLVLFVGGEEEKNGNAKLKDMRSGEESLISLGDMVREIKNRLSGTK